jgi:hypothetical protein
LKKYRTVDTNHLEMSSCIKCKKRRPKEEEII